MGVCFKRKIIFGYLVVIITTITLLSVACSSIGLENKDEGVNLTKVDIEKSVIEMFCREDGSFDTSYWERGEDIGVYKEEVSKEICQIIDGTIKITGFSVQLLKGIDEEKNWYLVEFEPSGHIVGKTNEKFSIAGFRKYRSPFKLLNISTENRYVHAAGYYGVAQGIDYLTKHNGYLCSFGNRVIDAYIKDIYIENTSVLLVYNQETHVWENKNIKEILLEENKNEKK